MCSVFYFKSSIISLALGICTGDNGIIHVCRDKVDSTLEEKFTEEAMLHIESLIGIFCISCAVICLSMSFIRCCEKFYDFQMYLINTIYLHIEICQITCNGKRCNVYLSLTFFSVTFVVQFVAIIWKKLVCNDIFYSTHNTIFSTHKSKTMPYSGEMVSTVWQSHLTSVL